MCFVNVYLVIGLFQRHSQVRNLPHGISTKFVYKES